MNAENKTAPANIDLWYVGVGLNVLASLFVTVGMMVQKLVHNRLSAEGRADTVSYYTQPLWVIGLVLMVSEVIIDLATFGLAPVSILAPLSSIVLVWNALLAPLILGESISRIQLLATGIILVGAILAVAFATQDTPTYEIDDIIGFLSSPLFLVFEISMAGVLINLHLSLQIKDAETRAKRKNKAKVEEIRESRALAMRNGEVVDENEDLSHHFIDLYDILNSQTFKYVCACYTKGLVRITLWFYGPTLFGDYGLTVAYAFMTASLSGQTVGGAKLVIEMIKTTGLNGTPFYLEWIWYVLVVYTILVVLLMLRYLNEMLARFEALVAVPIYQALLVIMQLGTAAFLFNEFGSFGLLQIIFFPIGTLICILGIYVLSKAQRAEVLEEFENDDVEVAVGLSFVPRVDVRRPSVERILSKKSLDALENT